MMMPSRDGTSAIAHEYNWGGKIFCLWYKVAKQNTSRETANRE